MLQTVAKSGMMEHFRVHVYCLWLCSLAITMQSWPGRFMVLWCFYVQEQPQAQLAVVLVLKHLRRWGHSLKSHPTDWAKPGI